MFSDPISDMLTRVRNALGARQSKVEVPASRLKIDIVRILKEEGYIANYRVADEEGKKTIKIYLKYQPDHIRRSSADRSASPSPAAASTRGRRRFRR